MFKIHYDFTKDCVEVKKELIRAINETITTRRIVKEMQLEVGFYCPYKVEDRHIATIWEEDQWTLYCTSKKDVICNTPEKTVLYSLNQSSVIH